MLLITHLVPQQPGSRGATTEKPWSPGTGAPALCLPGALSVITQNTVNFTLSINSSQLSSGVWNHRRQTCSTLGKERSSMTDTGTHTTGGTFNRKNRETDRQTEGQHKHEEAPQPSEATQPPQAAQVIQLRMHPGGQGHQGARAPPSHQKGRKGCKSSETTWHLKSSMTYLFKRITLLIKDR